MRSLYTYQVVRYFPNINSDEFFNVGIRLVGEKRQELHFIQDEHLSKLFVFPSIDKKHVVSFIELLSKERDFSHWYGNNLRFSENRRFRSAEKFEKVLELLYEDFIGYKFHLKEKVDPIEVVKEKAIQIVNSEFKNRLVVTSGELFDFELRSVKSNAFHYSKVGSIGNKNHLFEAIMGRAKMQSAKPSANNIFDFLNIHEDPTATVGMMLLGDNNIQNTPFDTEQNQINYFQKVAGL